MTKMTAAKTLEAIGLSDLTVAALLKELKENAMTKSEVEMDWSLSETAKRQLEEIELATIRPGDVRLNNVIGPRPADEPVAWADEIIDCLGLQYSPEQEADIRKAVLNVTPPRPDASAELAKENKFLQLQLNALRDLWAERDAAPPRPDASAGLIEAAVRAAFEEAAQIADSFGDRHEEFEPGDAIRARAADRSGAK